MVKLFKKFVLVGTSALFLAGCTTLPRSGPTDQSIVGGAATSLENEQKGALSKYALIDINQHVVDHAPKFVEGSFRGTFGNRSNRPASVTIGAGDVIQVSVFEEPGENALFSSQDDAGFFNFPPQSVDQSGSINIPFAGSVRVAGRQTSQVELEIQLFIYFFISLLFFSQNL